MSRVCELTGVGVQFGHNVSHSERKTNRKFCPNLQNVTLISDKLNARFKFRVAAKALKSVDAYGGLDNYLLNTNNTKLSTKSQKLKKRILNEKEHSS